MRTATRLPGSTMALCLASLALCGAALLSGCAMPAGGARGTDPSGVVLPSEESEARKRARVRLELASRYFDQGQTNVALEEVKLALATDPAFAEAFNLRALVYMRLNDLALAEESFRQAQRLSPRDPGTAHNYGWFLCQQRRYDQAVAQFAVAVENLTYTDKAKTWLAQGMCQQQAGQDVQAEQSLLRSYELDPANPITGYNLTQLLFKRGDLQRAQFYIRRINNSEYANAESLWLGIKVERSLGNRQAVEQLGTQLRNRFVQSREYMALERQAFDE
ncbi:type IV pilus biogenesis/stability protein PilW [Pseudorhodoferax soli]|uniref:Type IV pilus assembly protein PilF n=1 Tax=Pseudorhodoferax soli TaxID=545864 RepID=A0A368Y676_9BURK|nr:type IV pilus biogenesis/stability protein PilW [Pseudorhodoferax soli]RCW75790.1 type IV pilus assembly protein PilF [Pseudorhodoferax soli]